MSVASVHLVRASDVGGLPVVTIDGGDDAAEIKDVVYDAGSHRLVGFTLNKRGWFRGSLKAVLAADAIAGIGADAVMIADESALSDLDAGGNSLATPGSNHRVMGNTVMSADGTALGEVVDVIIETGTDPQAVGYEVETNDGTVFVPISAQMGLSGENLVVPAAATEFISNDLVGFGASVRTFRERLGNNQSGATS